MWQTDRQTDGQKYNSQDRASIAASRGKNAVSIDKQTRLLKIFGVITLPYLRGEQPDKQATQHWVCFKVWPNVHPRCNKGHKNLSELWS